MVQCPICQLDLAKYRPTKWDPWYQCRCGALFEIRSRLLLPIFPTLGLRKSEPIRLPPPSRFFAYYFHLTRLFGRLRFGCSEEIRRVAGELAPACDLIRFGSENPQPIPEIDNEDLGEVVTKVDRWPVFRNLELWHSNLDFAHWALIRIASGELDDRVSSGIGYIYQHFPIVHSMPSSSSRVEEAWQLAKAGRLPSPKRAKIRGRMQW